MESAEYSLDELLCQSLLLFRQYRFYDAPECGEKAFRMLEEAHVWMGRTQECVDMAKWGCVIECLAQKYYIEDDTDAILEEIDAALYGGKNEACQYVVGLKMGDCFGFQSVMVE